MIVLMFIRCESKNITQTNSDFKINGTEIKIYTIDSCEYIGVVIGSRADFLTHRGNCPNKIHYERKK